MMNDVTGMMGGMGWGMGLVSVLILLLLILGVVALDQIHLSWQFSDVIGGRHEPVG